MSDMPLVIHERSGRWGVALRMAMDRWPSQYRRATPGDGPRLLETRSVVECMAALEEHPTACVAVEFTLARGDTTWELLARISRDFRQARGIVLADRGLTDWEYAARELGAIHYVDSPRRVGEVLQVARRRAEQLARDPGWREAAGEGGVERHHGWGPRPALPWSDIVGEWT